MSKDDQSSDLTPKGGDPGHYQEIKKEGSNSDGPPRVRRRIKVRKRVRIKKKPNQKKKVKKYAEKAFWILIIAGFVISLIIMIVQLDISDKKFKQKQKKSTRSADY